MDEAAKAMLGTERKAMGEEEALQHVLDQLPPEVGKLLTDGMDPTRALLDMAAYAGEVTRRLGEAQGQLHAAAMLPRFAVDDGLANTLQECLDTLTAAGERMVAMRGMDPMDRQMKMERTWNEAMTKVRQATEALHDDIEAGLTEVLDPVDRRPHLTSFDLAVALLREKREAWRQAEEKDRDVPPLVRAHERVGRVDDELQTIDEQLTLASTRGQRPDVTDVWVCIATTAVLAIESDIREAAQEGARRETAAGESARATLATPRQADCAHPTSALARSEDGTLRCTLCEQTARGADTWEEDHARARAEDTERLRRSGMGNPNNEEGAGR